MILHWPSSSPSGHPGDIDAPLSPLAIHRTLLLGQEVEDGQHQFAGRTGQVDHSGLSIRRQPDAGVCQAGNGVKSVRLRASTASASEILSPARHSIRNSSRALGFGAARMSASISWASRYSGSCSTVFSSMSRRDLGCWPLGRR